MVPLVACAPEHARAMVRLVHQRGELRHLRTQLIGHLAPLLARHLGIVLHEGGADEGGNDTPSLASGMRQHVAHEVNPTPLPRGMQHRSALFSP